MLPPGSKRESGDWSWELEGLQDDPPMMLLAAVCLRARRDARGSWQARGFLRRVEQGYAESGDAGYAVLMAMEAGTGTGKNRMDRMGRTGLRTE